MVRWAARASVAGVIAATAILFLVVVQNRATLKAPLPTELVVELDSVPDAISAKFLVETAPEFLRTQVMMGTIPELYLGNLIRFENKDLKNFLRWSRQHLLDRFLIESGNQPYGSFILFGANFGGIYRSDQFKDYVALIKRKYTLTLRLRSRRDGSEKIVQIEPIISADCVPNNVPIHYCRVFSGVQPPKDKPDGEYSGALEAAEDYKTVGDIYSSFGLDSPLGPNVDFQVSGYIRNLSDLEAYAAKAATLLHEKKIIPVLKHFGYDQSKNVHFDSYLEALPMDSLQKILAPYSAVEGLGFPYMIMTTHFKLGALDSANIQTKSRKVVDFIHARFPSALIVTDALNMLGYSHGGPGAFPLLKARLKTMLGMDDLKERLLEAQGDLFIIHSANWWPIQDRRRLYQGLMERDRAETEASIVKVLALKEHYGLIKVYTRHTAGKPAPAPWLTAN